MGAQDALQPRLNAARVELKTSVSNYLIRQFYLQNSKQNQNEFKHKFILTSTTPSSLNSHHSMSTIGSAMEVKEHRRPAMRMLCRIPCVVRPGSILSRLATAD
jgi:hypothetical protein